MEHLKSTFLLSKASNMLLYVLLQNRSGDSSSIIDGIIITITIIIFNINPLFTFGLNKFAVSLKAKNINVVRKL